MYITSCIYSVGQSTQFSYAVVDTLSAADNRVLLSPAIDTQMEAIGSVASCAISSDPALGH
jgi:hypothetical protein